MPHPLLIVSQSDYLIWIDAINSHTKWQTVQIQINWILQKPTDLDLHCLQRQGISGFSRTSRKYIILTPLKPHIYIVKLGFTGIYIIFLLSAKNIDCGYSLEPPCRGSSNEYPQFMFWAEIWRLSDFFLSENFHFLMVKFSLYLNRRVFRNDKG